jgi:hypothetical protein
VVAVSSNHRVRHSVDIVRPLAVARFIEAAHANGMLVVAWYLPGLRDVGLDLRRVRAALRFTTLAGQHFDGFGLDIEAPVVRSLARRNAAAVRLSRAIRAIADEDFPLAAIVPDARSTQGGGLWPGFPFRALRPFYDAFMPMAYSSVRVRGASRVAAYTLANVRYVRAMTGDARVPVHVLAGLANRMSVAEVGAALRASAAAGAVGASVYKVSWMRAAQWPVVQRAAAQALFGSRHMRQPGGPSSATRYSSTTSKPLRS